MWYINISNNKEKTYPRRLACFAEQGAGEGGLIGWGRGRGEPNPKCPSPLQTDEGSETKCGARSSPGSNRAASVLHAGCAEPCPSRAVLSRADPSRAVPCPAELSRAKPILSNPIQLDPTRSNPIRADPSRSEPCPPPVLAPQCGAGGWLPHGCGLQLLSAPCFWGPFLLTSPFLGPQLPPPVLAGGCGTWPGAPSPSCPSLCLLTGQKGHGRMESVWGSSAFAEVLP